MRKDMMKQITECYRRKFDGKKERVVIKRQLERVKKVDVDEYDEYDEILEDVNLRKKSSIRDHKVLNRNFDFGENLSPLFRFIDSKIGQKWDDVYSEIKENIGSGTLGDHVLIHVKGYVTENCYEDEFGIVRDSKGKPVISPNRTWRHEDVCVVDGILRTVTQKQMEKAFKRKEKAENKRRNNGKNIVKINADFINYYQEKDYKINIFLNSYEKLIDIKDKVYYTDNLKHELINEKQIRFYTFEDNQYKCYLFNPGIWDTDTYVMTKVNIKNEDHKVTTDGLIYVRAFFPVKEINDSSQKELEKAYRRQQIAFDKIRGISRYRDRDYFSRKEITEEEIQESLERKVLSNRRLKKMKSHQEDE